MCSSLPHRGSRIACFPSSDAISDEISVVIISASWLVLDRAIH
ncbi:hypothetical protein DVS28_a1576 [Euzebya pacifica]|uniref:Uncharacterized protein n=1 Tax=Euzebya pacifica TaxID=1608957 RepID=A0A346XVM2_9ACTN|nr:hypothetical protein DVS28_a1576 [Euzebya pacifica]